MLQIDGLVKIYETEGRKRWGRERAVDDVSLTVGDGEFYTLLGPSGCGKTTLLRCVGGLEEPTSGTIRVADRVLFSTDDRVNVPAHQRDLAMVFQSYAIWPHMTVFQNAAYPLTVRGRRRPRQEVRATVEQVLAALGLSEFAQRSATELSGGQQQRLALARAIVQRPPLLLLDEPLSNLDAKLRQSMRAELRRLQQDLGLTVLYVTHDQAEALAMSSVIAVVNDGRVAQIGTPREVYERPVSRFVADFVGTANFVPGTVISPPADGRPGTVETALGTVRAIAATDVTANTTVEVLVRPEQVALFRDGVDAGHGARSGKVLSAAYQGDCIEYHVLVAGQEFSVRCGAAMDAAVDDEVVVELADSAYPIVEAA